MERFGRYVLLERIAHGGMAEVFRAASVGTAGFSKQLAVKRILPHLAAEKAFVTMLIDEAKIAATLNHPNILQVLDLGRENGIYFIAMEFVSGQALNNVVATAIRAQFRLPPAFCFHVIAQALHGLDYAHQKTDALGQPMGIIHRDVSPQNIMVAYDGAVRLADFGIAKAAERSTQTLTGSLKGKPAYMSPEQVQGKPIDQRMDIYAMGVVLHELLAMKRMRKAQTDVQILLDVAKGEFPKFEQLGVDIPAEATRVVYKALEPEPDERWQTAREFAMALEEASRKLGWHCSQAQVSEVMQKLFPAELDNERAAQNHFQAVATRLASADTDEVSNIIRSMQPPPGEISGLQTIMTPAPNANHNLPTLSTPAPSGTGIPSLRQGTGQVEVPQGASGVGKIIGAVVGAMLLLGGGAFFMMQQQQPGVGQLIIETTPAGAQITVGGKKQKGVTPLVAEGLPEGPIELYAEMEGMVATKDVVTVEAGKARKINLTLNAREVLLPIRSTPAGAQVQLDGKMVGQTPLTITLSGAKQVVIRLEAPGHLPLQQELLPLEAPASLDLTLTKKEERAPPPSNDRDRDRDRGKGKRDKNEDEGGTGLLTLRSNPWAKIFIDGKDTGRFTPVAELPLPAGKHSIKLVNDEEGLSTSFTITVTAGQKLNVNKELD